MILVSLLTFAAFMFLGQCLVVINNRYSPGSDHIGGYAHVVRCEPQAFLDGGGVVCEAPITDHPDDEIRPSSFRRIDGLELEDVGRVVPVFYDETRPGRGWKTAESRNTIRNWLHVPLLVMLFLLLPIWLGLLRWASRLRRPPRPWVGLPEEPDQSG